MHKDIIVHNLNANTDIGSLDNIFCTKSFKNIKTRLE